MTALRYVTVALVLFDSFCSLCDSATYVTSLWLWFSSALFTVYVTALRSVTVVLILCSSFCNLCDSATLRYVTVALDLFSSFCSLRDSVTLRDCGFVPLELILQFV